MQNWAFFQKTELVFFVLSVIIILEFIWILVLQINLSLFKKRKKLKIEGDPKNLEEALAKQGETIKTLDKDIHELYNISNQINGLAFKGLHKVGVIRFNPFKDVGGNQSFAIALLNGKNNGVVISSLFTREGTRVYSKAVLDGKSEKYPLTQEEEQAIKKATIQNTKKRLN